MGRPGQYIREGILNEQWDKHLAQGGLAICLLPHLLLIRAAKS